MKYLNYFIHFNIFIIFKVHFYKEELILDIFLHQKILNLYLQNSLLFSIVYLFLATLYFQSDPKPNYSNSTHSIINSIIPKFISFLETLLFINKKITLNSIPNSSKSLLTTYYI
jgi:hypothetical protein